MSLTSVIFSSTDVFNDAVNVLALEAVEYEVDEDVLTIFAEDGFALLSVLESHEIEDFEVEENDDEDADESMDGDHATALASAGFGTDEDYGYFGGGEDE